MDQVFLAQVGTKSTFITGVGLWWGLDEQEGLLVRDAFLQLELDQRQDLERHERVNERLKTIDDFWGYPEIGSGGRWSTPAIAILFHNSSIGSNQLCLGNFKSLF